MTKKTKKLAILLVALMTSCSMFFASCNDDEQLTNKEISMQNKITVKIDHIPDGLYKGYYKTASGSVIKIAELIKEDEIIRRWVNGKEQPKESQPYVGGRFDGKTWGSNEAARLEAMDIASELSKKFPCVAVIATQSPDNEDIMVYTVEYEIEHPCEYEK